MDVTIVYKPEFWLQVPAETARLMCRLSAMHYDGVCKAASQPGGFLFTWANWADDEIKLPASPRQLDTAMKIMEMPPSCTDEERALIVDLRDTIRRVMKEAGVWK